VRAPAASGPNPAAQRVDGGAVVLTDVRLEAAARALCAWHGADPDAPALKSGKLVPTWHIYAPEARAVLTAADAVDGATPEMQRAGMAAMEAGSHDAASLVQRIWLAMTALRPGGAPSSKDPA
jgi:hypothetical protein